VSGPGGGAVRRAARRDRDRVAELWLALTEHHASIDPLFALREDAGTEVGRIVEAQLRDADTALFVWDEDGDLPGLCIVRVDRAPPIHEEVCRGEITDLFVQPDARRKGVGRALLEAGLGWARERGAKRLEVRVVRANPEGQAFWRAAGFADFMDVLHRPL
jgi:GNAT superfamily N-acetyltransferase